MHLGLLDQPLVLEGKRKRKSVQSFQSPDSAPSKKKKVEVEEGRGLKLGDISSVDAALNKKKTDELRPLYKLLFDQQGNRLDIKKHVRSFSGFPFREGTDDYKKRQASLERLQKLALVNLYCQPLGLSVTGNKTELANRIMRFLMKPQGVKKSTPGRSTPVRKPSKRIRVSKGNQEKDEANQKEDEEMEVQQVDDTKQKDEASTDDSPKNSAQLDSESSDQQAVSSEDQEHDKKMKQELNKEDAQELGKRYAQDSGAVDSSKIGHGDDLDGSLSSNRQQVVQGNQEDNQVSTQPSGQERDKGISMNNIKPAGESAIQVNPREDLTTQGKQKPDSLDHSQHEQVSTAEQ